ncbi:MAG: glycoside hydrolase family 18 protein [Bacillota bacterium]|nr:glycoside hydrolase family 18 protein [Bacillota bacterium]
MKKQILLLVAAVFIIFTGGFFTGTFFSSKSEQQKSIRLTKMPTSKLILVKKRIPHQSKILIGYVQDFRNPNMVDYSKLTHVIFSFAHPTKDGKILLNGTMALNNLRTTVEKAKKHHTKVMVAVGGWFHIQGGESYPYFKAAISHPISRTRLVNELNHLVNREKLDGIDIDFEYPRSPNEAKNLSDFVKELSNGLHSQRKELSIAVNSKINAASGKIITSVVYEPSMFQYVDHVNIMGYDGQWDNGYHAANLSPYPFTQNIVIYWTNLFLQYHLPKNKLILGVPSYGQPDNPAIKQISYASIINKNPSNAIKDVVYMNGTTYHFNGELTIRKKVNLAVTSGLGGLMIWEEGLDARGENSLTTTIFNKLKDPEKNIVLNK